MVGAARHGRKPQLIQAVLPATYRTQLVEAGLMIEHPVAAAGTRKLVGIHGLSRQLCATIPDYTAVRSLASFSPGRTAIMRAGQQGQAECRTRSRSRQRFWSPPTSARRANVRSSMRSHLRCETGPTDAAAYRFGEPKHRSPGIVSRAYGNPRPLGAASRRTHPASAVSEILNIGVAKMAMRDDDPRQGITDYLRKHPTDLLVMATEGRTGLARLLQPLGCRDSQLSDQ